jgi:hypothetical protein
MTLPTQSSLTTCRFPHDAIIAAYIASGGVLRAGLF